MKKIIGLIAAVLVVFGLYKGYEYYNVTYKATPAYAKVPAQVPELKDTVDDAGKKIAGSKSYSYKLTVITTDGERRVLDYNIEDADPLTPNAYVKADISQKRVVKGPEGVQKSDVPTSVLEKLK